MTRRRFYDYPIDGEAGLNGLVIVGAVHAVFIALWAIGSFG